MLNSYMATPNELLQLHYSNLYIIRFSITYTIEGDGSYYYFNRYVVRHKLFDLYLNNMCYAAIIHSLKKDYMKAFEDFKKSIQQSLEVIDLSITLNNNQLDPHQDMITLSNKIRKSEWLINPI